MWGSHVVIPPPGRKKLLQELRIGHPGICRMKGLARTVMWWPNIDSQIEDIVKGCNECQLTRASPALILYCGHPNRGLVYTWTKRDHS